MLHNSHLTLQDPCVSTVTCVDLLQRFHYDADRVSNIKLGKLGLFALDYVTALYMADLSATQLQAK